MKIGVLPIRKTETTTLFWIKEKIAKTFPNTTCTVVNETIPLRKENFDEKREQYRSHAILSEIQSYATMKPDFTRVLGVVDADIFVPELSFVFGEATYPGKAALISLWRLKP